MSHLRMALANAARALPDAELRGLAHAAEAHTLEYCDRVSRDAREQVAASELVRAAAEAEIARRGATSSAPRNGGEA